MTNSNAARSQNPEPHRRRRKVFSVIARVLLIGGLLAGATVTGWDRWLAATGDTARGSSAVFVVGAQKGSLFDEGRPIRTTVVITQEDKHVEVCFLVAWNIVNDVNRFQNSATVDPFAYVFGGRVYATSTTKVTDLPSEWGPGKASTQPRIVENPRDSAWQPVDLTGKDFKMNFPVRYFVPPSAGTLAENPNAPAQVWASGCLRMLAEPSSSSGLMKHRYQFGWGHLTDHTIQAGATGDVDFVVGEVASEPVVKVEPTATMLSAYLRSVTFPFDSSPLVTVTYQNTAGQALVDAAAWVTVSAAGVLLAWILAWMFLRKRTE